MARRKRTTKTKRDYFASLGIAIVVKATGKTIATTELQRILGTDGSKLIKHLNKLPGLKSLGASFDDICEIEPVEVA